MLMTVCHFRAGSLPGIHASEPGPFFDVNCRFRGNKVHRGKTGCSGGTAVGEEFIIAKDPSIASTTRAGRSGSCGKLLRKNSQHKFLASPNLQERLLRRQ
jgi:hypothetical protein